MCLFHSYQQCFLAGVLNLAIISCFTKGVPHVHGKVGAGEYTTRLCRCGPGTSLAFTNKGGSAGASNDWCITTIRILGAKC